MKILLLGSGGRESALAWKISQSPLLGELYVYPGNPGMTRISEKIRLIDVTDRSEFIPYGFDLVVVGPEALLAEGIVDFFEAHGIPAVGPSREASQLEASKAFCKEMLLTAGIPTAKHEVVTSLSEGLAMIEAWASPDVVLKVDGLAQGKGVIIAENKRAAREGLVDLFSGRFLGYPVQKVILEERLQGQEASAFALCDGTDFVYLGSASDYKRLNDGDEGPNTGGMGTVSPSPCLTPKDEDWVKENVFRPVLEAMRLRGHPFKGFLFAGLMKSPAGSLNILEFNVRLGDPETQSLLPRIHCDLVPLLLAAAQGNLKTVSYEEVPRGLHALHVVMSAQGYPGINGESLRKGDLITIKTLSTGSLREQLDRS